MRPRVVVLVAGCDGGDIAALLLALPTTQQRFVDFNTADCKVVYLPLFNCCKDFCKVVVSFSCCFRALALLSS